MSLDSEGEMAGEVEANSPGCNWGRITLFQGEAGVPSNTNPVERAIGWSKIRYRSCLGMKSVEGIFAHPATPHWQSRVAGSSVKSNQNSPIEE